MASATGGLFSVQSFFTGSQPFGNDLQAWNPNDSKSYPAKDRNIFIAFEKREPGIYIKLKKS
jgi:hypothetical protein